MTTRADQELPDASESTDDDDVNGEIRRLFSIETASEQQGNDAQCVPDRTPAQQCCAAIYIDADNQSAKLAQPLCKVLAENFLVGIARVTLAGNDSGNQLECWKRHLHQYDAAICTEVLEVPLRKDAADIALILELGSHLDHHIQQQDLVIVMSRDELIIGAAEQAKARGARVVLAYADSSIPNAGSSELVTLLLPTASKVGKVVTPPTPPSNAVKATNTISSTVATVDKNSVPSVLAGLRKMCPKQTGGGYSPTHIGQALFKMGFDAAARKALLKKIPNLETRGSGPTKILLF